MIIKEVRPPQPPPPPPLVVRQRAPPLPQPPPLVLREKPPPIPAAVGAQTGKYEKIATNIYPIFSLVIRKLPPVPVPPRSVIIERLPPLPPKPSEMFLFHIILMLISATNRGYYHRTLDSVRSHDKT